MSQLEWVQDQGEEGRDFCVNYENSRGGMVSRLGWCWSQECSCRESRWEPSLEQASQLAPGLKSALYLLGPLAVILDIPPPCFELGEVAPTLGASQLRY